LQTILISLAHLVLAYKKHNIVNSQFVHIEQTPAAIGFRILAQMIDRGICIIYYIIIGSSTATLFDFKSIIPAIIAIILYLLPVLYPLISEWMFNGLTIGKKATGIRVVMQDGQSVNFSSCFLRWVLSFIEVYFFCIGIIPMMCNKMNMRIGDMAAGTIVIRENTSSLSYQSLALFSSLSSTYEPKYPFASNLTWGQVCFINETTYRFGFYAANKRDQNNIRALAQKIAQTYNFDLGDRNPNTFLQDIVKDYNYYTWHNNV